MPDTLRATLVHNPSAGSGRTSGEELIELVRRCGHVVHYCSSKSDRLDEALRRAADLIIVAGGDGVVAKVAAKLPDRAVPLAILPLGGANNIASALGVRGAPAELARGWRTATRRFLNIGIVRGPWGMRRFVDAVGFGVLAHTLDPEFQRLEPEWADKLRRGRVLLRRAVESTAPAACMALVDDEEFAAELILLEALNCALSGPGLLLAPRADQGDGMLDLITLGANQRSAMLDWLRSDVAGPAPVTRRRIRRIEFVRTPAPMRIDDKLQGPELSSGSTVAELEAEPVRVLVPGAPG